mgnify:CR=1 FL=1
MTLVRGDRRLPLEPAWVDRLSERGAIDPYACAPDLERWRRRALRKAGLEHPEQDPATFQAVFDALTERDRAAASPWGLALFKLSSPAGWIVGQEEIDALLPHVDQGPLRDFLEGGPFEIRS